jgi:glycerol uptake facilitator-like aquaporin
MARELVAEALGTALLLAVVVGSGIMGESLAGGSTAVALLANSLATGAALVVLILVFGPISGAHLNPVVTLSAAVRRKLAWSKVGPYLAAQLLGALAGVLLAHLMFGEPAFAASSHARSGPGQLTSEAVATFGLLLTILAVERNRPAAVPYAVALFIMSAYWFTASTSFANPAVTVARAATRTFAGIRPADVPGFVVAQLAGGAATLALVAWLWRPARSTEEASAVPLRPPPQMNPPPIAPPLRD